jgi:adapter protein MecA 1/2
MIFRRIDSKTVNCIITPQDMENHGIRLDDLFERKEQAMEFLHMIVGEAQRRVNFKPDGAVTSMQMTVLPDHSVSLTLSEQSGTQFRILLKKIQQKLGIAIPDNLKKELEKLSEDQKIERLKDYAARVQSGEEREKAAREAGLSSGTGSDVNPAGTSADITLSGKTHGRQMKKEKSAGQAAGQNADSADGAAVLSDFFLYEFLSSLSEEKKMKDVCVEVYVRRNVYYLVLDRNGADASSFSQTALSLNEYGRMVTAGSAVIAHVREIYRPVLKRSTIGKLSSKL